MKKWKAMLAVLLIVLFALFAVASGTEETDNQGSGSATVDEAVMTEDSSNLGDYSVVIDSCRLAKDYEGKSVVIVKYIFTNVADDDAAAFFVTVDETVYQGGVSLNESYFVADDANYSTDNQMKEIKKGASLDVEVAYELNDTTSDIEVEVEELFSFDDRLVTKTFSIG